MTRTNHRTDPLSADDRGPLLSESANMGRGQRKRDGYNLMGIAEIRERRAYSEARKMTCEKSETVGDTFDEIFSSYKINEKRFESSEEQGLNSLH